MSAEQLAKFEPLNYVDKLRDRMRQTMVDLIPDDQWNAMISSEIKLFFEDVSQTSWNTGRSMPAPSPLRSAIRSVLEEDAKKRVQEMINGPEWTSHWDSNGKESAGQKVVDVVKQYGAEIMGKWIEGAVQQVINNLRYAPR